MNVIQSLVVQNYEPGKVQVLQLPKGDQRVGCVHPARSDVHSRQKRSEAAQGLAVYPGSHHQTRLWRHLKETSSYRDLLKRQAEMDEPFLRPINHSQGEVGSNLAELLANPVRHHLRLGVIQHDTLFVIQ